MNYEFALACLATGVGAITLIDSAGAIASRKFNFNFSLLAVLSVAVFIGCGYFLSAHYPLSTTLLTCTLLGFYDGTIGLWLSRKLRARTGLTDADYTSLMNPTTTLIIIGLSAFFGWIGFLLA